MAAIVVIVAKEWVLACLYLLINILNMGKQLDVTLKVTMNPIQERN